jgi:hypothetical protein
MPRWRSPCASAMGRHRRIPRKPLSMREGVPSPVDQQVCGPCGKPRCGPPSGIRAGCPRQAVGQEVRRRLLGVGRLVAEAAGAIDGAQQDLQHVDRAAGLEPVGMGRDARASRASPRAGRSSCRACAPGIGPGTVEGDLPPRRPHARSRRRCGGSVGRMPVARPPRPAHSHRTGSVRPSARTPGRHGRPSGSSRTRRSASGFPPFPLHQALPLAGRPPAACRPRRARTARPPPSPGVDHQPGRVGVADQVVEIDLAGAESSWISARQQPVGAGRDADPFVGNGVVARADRVDPTTLAPRSFSLPSPS